MIEWGMRFDKPPDDTVIGRPVHDDGTVTYDIALRSKERAIESVESDVPIGAIRKKLIRREVTPWEVIGE